MATELRGSQATAKTAASTATMGIMDSGRVVTTAASTGKAHRRAVIASETSSPRVVAEGLGLRFWLMVCPQ